ncbi:MAG: hypothetical protein M1828_000089 [Chrysothrix sp. TS-e1954]|nr:MAG: hypothetical protein M1828_000089 [Chrysothrix sp. TS-e1954]
MFKPRTIGIAAAVAGAGYLALSQMEDLKTPGMRNIEKAHTRAGGAPNHTPAQASKLGDENDGNGYQREDKSIQSKHFQDGISEQQPDATMVGGKWNKAMHGHEKSKTQNKS